jgi:transposase-like protein
MTKQLLRENGSPQTLFNKGGLYDQLKKRFIEMALDAEMEQHLGYPRHLAVELNSGNSRNGRGSKTIIVDQDQFEIQPPRDRNASFEKQLIPKRQTRFKVFDEKILAMYARGMSMRDMHSKLWRNYLELITPHFTYQAEIRKVMYTTNAIESRNRSLRKVLKTKGSFPNDESILKLIYLAMQNIAKKWTMPIQNWGAVLNVFSIKFKGRTPI